MESIRRKIQAYEMAFGNSAPKSNDESMSNKEKKNKLKICILTFI